MLSRAKSFMERYERRLSVGAFLLGFLWDSLTLTRVDRLYDNVVLATYLTISFIGIVALNAHGAGRLRGFLSEKIIGAFRILLPFALGGLFSGLLIFYSRSGAGLGSAPFLLVLGAFFLGNEFFKRHYERFVFQMTVFFVALFSYTALVVPVLVGDTGAPVFVLSGCISVALFFILLRVLRHVATEEVERSRRMLIPIVVSIFLAFNVLYFNNMIPPIPLSLKEVGVYHDISRTRAGAYVLSFEKAPWYALGRTTGTVFHTAGKTSVYAFSSVYAPTKFDTSIVHHWSRMNEASGEWVSMSVIPFAISGGRAEGYRGYSIKENISPGKWRVDVETPRGQIIGRFVFTVEDTGASTALTTEVR